MIYFSAILFVYHTIWAIVLLVGRSPWGLMNLACSMMLVLCLISSIKSYLKELIVDGDEDEFDEGKTVEVQWQVKSRGTPVFTALVRDVYPDEEDIYIQIGKILVKRAKRGQLPTEQADPLLAIACLDYELEILKVNEVELG